MKLTTRGRYGTRLMLELAKNYGKGPVSISAISRTQNIPVKYLEQLIIPLKKANLIRSLRGPKGGHMLSKSPDNINIWDVLLLLESNPALVDCLVNEEFCENSANCPVRPVWGKALEAMMCVLRETTLDGILKMANDRQTETEL